MGTAPAQSGGPLVFLFQTSGIPAGVIGTPRAAIHVHANVLERPAPAAFCSAIAADVQHPSSVGFVDPNGTDRALGAGARLQLARAAAGLCRTPSAVAAVNAILGQAGGGLLGPNAGATVLGASFAWSFFDPTEVHGSGAFTGPTGTSLDAVELWVPPVNPTTPRRITNFICPSQLPNGQIVTTTTDGDTLLCSGGQLPVGQTFQANVQTMPAPETGMGGRLFGRAAGSSSFAGPFAVSGP
jgi:hypothetical protein